MNVFRLHVKTYGDRRDSFAYCRENGLLGLGGSVNPDGVKSLTWDEYTKRATAEARRRVGPLHDRVKPDDLIWTRDPHGKYYLARVCSPWEYLNTEKGREVDVVNVVRCDLREVPLVDDVPGTIVACFRARRTIQQISNPTAVSYSQMLWNDLSGTTDYALSPEQPRDIFACLNSESVEDVIFMYLQHHGWFVVPNSRKADTMAYEFGVIHPKTRERALVQVKTGDARLRLDEWDCREKVFLFQTSGLYDGVPTTNVVKLLPAEIDEFMREHSAILPGSVQRWVARCACGRIPQGSR
jgi:hypothetical protein